MNLKDLAAEYVALNQMAQEAAAERDAIADRIKELMGSEEKAQAGEYRITWASVKQSRLDSKALKRDFPELAERYTTETSYKRFTVKV